MELQREYLRGARRKAQHARDYFDDEDEEETHARGSTGASFGSGGDLSPPKGESSGRAGGGADDEEVDPLDAFMMGIDAQVVREKTDTTKSKLAEKVRRSLVDMAARS